MWWIYKTVQMADGAQTSPETSLKRTPISISFDKDGKDKDLETSAVISFGIKSAIDKFRLTNDIEREDSR